MPLTSTESAQRARLGSLAGADFANGGHRTRFPQALNDVAGVAQGVARIATEADTTVDLLRSQYPNAGDIAAADSRLPVYNLFPDSGRLCPSSSTIYAGTFVAPPFFTPFNGASAWTSAGLFEHSGVSQPGAVSSLLAHVGDTRNSGPEFYVGQITAGTGTSAPVTDNGVTYYLMTVNGTTILPYLSTFGAFIRVFSGALYIGNPHQQDGVDFSAAPLPFGAWRYVRIKKTAALGFDNAFPNFRATPGSVIQIALPSLIPGHFAQVPIDRALPVLAAGVYA